MNILIVDDDTVKRANVHSLLRSEGVNAEAIKEASNLRDARDHMSNLEFDLVILDLNIPEHPDSQPNQSGGIDLITELSRGERLRLPRWVIGLTSYAEIAFAQQELFGNFGWSIILYNSTSTDWEFRIRSKVQYINRQNFIGEKATAKQFFYDVAIVCALQSPEFDEVRKLNFFWEEHFDSDDSQEYLIGRCHVHKSAPLKVIACSPSHMGLCASSVAVTKLISRYRPKIIFMCGITAGVRKVTQLGDVLVAEESWDYNSGKIVEGPKSSRVFLPEPRSIPIESDLRDLLNGFASRGKFIRDIWNNWVHGKRPPTLPSVRIGPIASGSAVVQDQNLITELIKRNRKLIGIEMETYAVYFAARHSYRPRPLFCSVKGVCDFADKSKNDNFHAFAAYASARYVESILCSTEFQDTLRNCC